MSGPDKPLYMSLMMVPPANSKVCSAFETQIMTLANKTSTRMGNAAGNLKSYVYGGGGVGMLS